MYKNATRKVHIFLLSIRPVVIQEEVQLQLQSCIYELCNKSSNWFFQFVKMIVAALFTHICTCVCRNTVLLYQFKTAYSDVATMILYCAKTSSNANFLHLLLCKNRIKVFNWTKHHDTMYLFIVVSGSVVSKIERISRRIKT